MKTPSRRSVFAIGLALCLTFTAIASVAAPTWLILVGIGLIGLLLVVSLAVEYTFPSQPHLPLISGQFAVGRRHASLGNGWALLYHPTGQNTDAPPAIYLPRPDAIAERLGLPSMFLEPLAKLQVEATMSTNAVSTKQPWIIYLHGGLGFPAESTTLCLEMASHGFKVIAPHMDLSAVASRLRRIKDPHQMVEALKDLEHALIPAQVADLHSALFEASIVNDWPTGPMEPNQGLIFIGHSLGAGIAARLVQRLAKNSNSVTGFVSLDGHLIGTLSDELPQLYLSQGIALNPQLPNGPLAEDQLRRIRCSIGQPCPHKHWLRFPEAGHGSFVDFPYLVRSVGPLRQILGRKRSITDDVRKVVMSFVAHPNGDVQVPTSAEKIL